MAHLLLEKKPHYTLNMYYYGTNVLVGIFGRSYSDTSWEFTREIEEEKLEF